jgi:hypothetical protein
MPPLTAIVLDFANGFWLPEPSKPSERLLRNAEDADGCLMALWVSNGSRSPICPAHAAEKSRKRQEKIKPERKAPRGDSSHSWRSVRASAAKRTRIREEAMCSLPSIAEALSRRFVT